MQQDSTPLSVSEITRSIKFDLETKFKDVFIEGEISNFKRQSSGHLYFSLKDQEAQIGAVMFRGSAEKLKILPKDGDKVTIRGSLSVYAPHGKYQVIVTDLKPSGLGELLVRLEELKIKLNKLGYFKQERKRPLPPFPKTIGIITSPTGAAIQDILNILNRRHSGFHAILNPVKVQGEGAAEEIAQAIREMNRLKLCDVLIVGRGGGSIEDLWAFNEEIVAHAIFESEIPIVGAVGHETDHTIAEYVADVRAPTPSAAAELVLKESNLLLNALQEASRRLTQQLRQLIRHDRQRLSGIQRHPFFTSPYALIGPRMQKLDHFQIRLEALKPTRKITEMKVRLAHINEKINHAILNKLEQKSFNIKKVDEILKAIDPKTLLTKGYSILFSEKDGSVIKSVRQLEKQEKIKLMLQDGSASSTITEIHHDR
ncbi:MAG: exodeoxyribonuclease VII large subunit [Chlamydiia bacterium]|nr:exodeoxyribonuclease VII large subunit [Chlamydiia bacterium]